MKIIQASQVKQLEGQHVILACYSEEAIDALLAALTATTSYSWFGGSNPTDFDVQHLKEYIPLGIRLYNHATTHNHTINYADMDFYRRSETYIHTPKNRVVL